MFFGRVEANSLFLAVKLAELGTPLVAELLACKTKKIRSFLGMVMYYQHFIEGCSAKAKPLFKLTAGSSKQTRGKLGRKKRLSVTKLAPTDWTPALQQAFVVLKSDLLQSVTLAQPMFDQLLFSFLLVRR